jgi:FeS assembly protein IscX
MKWTDINDIAIELSEAHPDVDPTKVNFVDLMSWVMALPGFRRRSQALRRKDSRSRSSRPGSTSDIPPEWQAGGRNAPDQLPRIAQALAGLRGISLQQVADATTNNVMAALPGLARIH